MTIKIPLRDSRFNLDISGVAGFFGGDVAVTAMATVHIYQGRKWLGWYNSPGSYEIAKRYGQLGRSRFWDGLYPGVNVDPAVLFELDGMPGPKYRGVHSGTTMLKTGHLAHLFLQECKDIPRSEMIHVDCPRVSSPIALTVVNLHHQPRPEEHPRLFRHSTSLACIPIVASLATCIACFVYEDWYCAAMILLGILTSGVSCYVIGTGRFTFTHPRHARGAPPGDGVLIADDEIIVLKGPEDAVTPITRGRFSLKFTSEPEYHNIGVCSMLLTTQFLAQLLLVPQGEIFGQLMFLSSLAVSWGYNSYLSSLDRESFQRRILVEQVLQLRADARRKYEFGTRTAMVVYVLLVLSPAQPSEALRKILDDLLPNETPVWNVWKSVVVEKVCSRSEWSDGTHAQGKPVFDRTANHGLRGEELKLLHTFFLDAEAAFYRYHQEAFYDEIEPFALPALRASPMESLSP
ncbi:hypothetical protein BN946_scf185042.g22 [Trametes cinnabarina]|uniref:Uncharacterized protein n=1 Tax=Pycnoporus cinnabarinus TaxID=5643 RepID=A0A060S466_PYCCI|nr:hypothetical protein BN946_scf185042.g22 [Trametes cinnabarina]